MILFQSHATSAAWLQPVFLIDYVGECIHEALNVHTASQVLRPNQSGGCCQRWLEALYAMKLGRVDLPTKGAPFFGLFLAACLGVVRRSLSTALNLLAFVLAVFF